ncbi:hypothetical protein KPL37_03180 [Clostridium frigoris]|uniref:PH domain-containing protein n=1 Tax=Clostridium frigoris TaxID=205327 RepID=A0ABS6BPE3_9CLOT|nr:DUF6106 family protein [Clostridium frigoris]MBU3158777.1 hypothetical protein [Clostridium frigoris]
MDNFYEQLVTTSKTTSYNIVSKSTYVLGLIGLFLASVNMIFAILLIALAVACYFYKSKLYVEYEYQFTNGEVDIEKILEMKKRKKVTTFNIKEVGLLALSDSDVVKDFSGKPTSIVKCYPTNTKGPIYVAMVTEGKDKMQLLFMPDEKFINLCFKYNPRAVKK